MSTAGAREHGLDRVSAPAYSTLDTDVDVVEDRTENPPDYSGPGLTSTSPRPASGRREHRRLTSSAQHTVEHSLSLSKGSKSSPQQPWLTLKLHSYAVSSTSTPTFFEGKPVIGLVELHVEKPDDIKDITVTFKGMVINKDVGDKRTFYQQEVTLWDRSMGDPHSPASPSSPSTFKDKLVGQFVWPFVMDLPNRIAPKGRDIHDFKLAKEERLPPNLRGLNDLPLLDYQIIVCIKRAHIFRLNSSLSSPVIYVPEIPVPRFTEVRERAYGQNAAYLPGPDADQGGWHRTMCTPVRGLMFKSREVEVDYSLFVALPTTYTRGAVVPLYLILQSKDKQAVDLLASPQAVRIGLGRTLTVPNRFTPELESHVGGNAGAARSCRVAWKAIEAENISSRSTPEHDGTPATFEQALYGEISLPVTLTPTFTFGQFCLKYFIDTYAPHPTGFESDSNASGRLSRTEVTISANSVIGSQPRNLLPPGEYPDIVMESADETFGALADALHRQSNVSAFGSRGDSLAH